MHYPAVPMPTQTPPESLPAISNAENIRAFCLRIMTHGDLETKLSKPQTPTGEPLVDEPTGPAVLLDRPARGPGLRMTGDRDRLPRPGQLDDAAQRIRCLSRFAHHELMAVEFFAWALLRWPDLPKSLRRAWLATIVDEQRHCRLYLRRLESHGGRFDTDDHSDYFWRQAPVIAASPKGPRAFLAAMGLTLEQANLDFTLTYRDGFAEAGDHDSAAVCQLVHDEEIAHVGLALRWLARLDPSAHRLGRNDLDLYLDCVPFPLGPGRAKGRRFEVGPRRKAGLSHDFVEHIRLARSTQESRTKNDRGQG